MSDQTGSGNQDVEVRGRAARTRSPRRALIELVVVVAVVVGALVAAGARDLVIFVACIIAMVMLHELGHLLAAKRGGMKVAEYFLGFGPRLWSVRHGETEYGVKALPLGGYVKIPGMTNLEEVDPDDEPRAYRNQPFHARLLVAVAGSAMHFLMAFVLLWSLFVFIGAPQTNRIAITGFAPVHGVANPARAAGLQPGDVVVSVDGTAVHGDTGRFQAAIQHHPGTPVQMVVERSGQERTLTVTPANGRAVGEKGVVAPAGNAPYGVIGVELGNPTERVGPLVGAGRTATGVVHLTWSSVTGVAHIFSPSGVASLFHQATDAQAAHQAAQNGTRLQSIVGVVQIGGDAVQAGVGDLLLILVVINLFIGVFNLFPMLPLDGGHVVIAVYEKIRTGRRRVMYHADVAKLMPFAWLMLTFLGVIFVTSVASDVFHPVTNPFH